MKIKSLLLSFLVALSAMAQDEYEILENTFSEGLAIAVCDDKNGFVDEEGNVVIPFVYDWVSIFSEGLAAAESDGKHGFINKTGETAIPFIYDGATGFYEGVALVELDGQRFYIDKSGNIVIKGDFIGESAFTEGLSLVSKDERYGFINHSGEIVIPIVYDYAYPFENGSAYVISDNKGWYINTKGDKISDVVDEIPEQLVLNLIGEDGQQYDLVLVGSYDEALQMGESMKNESNDSIDRHDEESLLTLDMIERSPRFPGGDEEMYSWMGENIVYPSVELADATDVVVEVSFIVRKNGTLTDVKIERGNNPAFNAEAMRIINTMPRWEPALNNGEPVDAIMLLPITFRTRGTDSD